MPGMAAGTTRRMTRSVCSATCSRGRVGSRGRTAHRGSASHPQVQENVAHADPGWSVSTEHPMVIGIEANSDQSTAKLESSASHLIWRGARPGVVGARNDHLRLEQAALQKDVLRKERAETAHGGLRLRCSRAPAGWHEEASRCSKNTRAGAGASRAGSHATGRSKAWGTPGCADPCLCQTCMLRRAWHHDFPTPHLLPKVRHASGDDSLRGGCKGCLVMAAIDEQLRLDNGHQPGCLQGRVHVQRGQLLGALITHRCVPGWTAGSGKVAPSAQQQWWRQSLRVCCPSAPESSLHVLNGQQPVQTAGNGQTAHA